MDCTRDGGLNAEERGAALATALNEQLLPQLALLAHGPLAEASAHAVQAALASEQGGATCTVLQLRVMVEGRLLTLVVQVTAGR